MAGKSSYKTKLKKATDVIGGVTSIKAPSYEREVIDVTDLNSPDDFMEFEPGFCDGGELQIDLNWNPLDANQKTKLLADVEAGTVATWTVEWSSLGVSVALTGFWKSFGPGADKGNKLAASATFKISGKPVWSYPA